MQKWIHIRMLPGRRPGGFMRLLLAVGCVAMMILLLPALGIIALVGLGIAAGAAIAGWLWWLLRGKKAVQKMQDELRQTMAGQQPGQEGPPRPRKKVNVTVHPVDE